MPDTEKEVLCARIDELCAEVEKLRQDNAKLREERNHWNVEQTHAYSNWEDAHKRVTELEAENARLRELVDELYPLADYGAMDESELDRAHDLMRELGLEVDG